MAAALDELLDSPAARAPLESAARARTVRDFSWDHIARRQAALYRELT
jgi:glycosyltransferase involved in cell wall biosynthesis